MQQIIKHRSFALEAIKITVYCVLVAICFYVAGASQTTILIMFNIAVMSAAATFSLKKKQIRDVFLGSLIILLSTVLGGVIGHYAPVTANLLTVVYAAGAFMLAKTKTWQNILINGAIVFLIFSFSPFDIHFGSRYLALGFLVTLSFTVFLMVFNRSQNQKTQNIASTSTSYGFNAGMLIAVALILAYLIAYFLQAKTTLQHIYWLPFTTLVIAQGVQLRTVTTAFKRIAVNTLGALLIIILFTYVLPSNFWINFTMLVIFLFCIFFFSFTYMGRTLFIELFVLGFTHLLGQYHNFIAYDRIIMTFLGGIIVILVTFSFLGYKHIQGYYQ